MLYSTFMSLQFSTGQVDYSVLVHFFLNTAGYIGQNLVKVNQKSKIACGINLNNELKDAEKLCRAEKNCGIK